MGGRGASSGQSSNGARASVSSPGSMSDSQLREAIRYTRQQTQAASDRLEELANQIEEARFSPREGRIARIEAAQAEYNEGSEIFNRLRDRQTALDNEQAARRAAANQVPPTPRTFVNSYGEATRRNITSQSYENAQRRLNRRLKSWLGR